MKFTINEKMKWYNILLTIALVFCVTISRAETTTIRMFVNGAENPRPVVLMTEKLASVKVTIKNNETGEEKEITSDEDLEAGCE
jgi:hypothetical protein